MLFPLLFNKLQPLPIGQGRTLQITEAIDTTAGSQPNPQRQKRDAATKGK